MTIGEFSEITGISPSTLRYYESRGLIRVNRDGAGRRDYPREDAAWAEFLQRLKGTGMSLEGMREYSRLRYEGDSTMQARLEMLLEHRKICGRQDKAVAGVSGKSGQENGIL